MITTFTTLNSTYEYNDESMMLRRVRGDNPCTPRTGVDGVWKEVQGVHRVGSPDRLWIVWSDGSSTLTSTLRSIEVDA